MSFTRGEKKLCRLMSGHIPNLNQVFREGGKARAENASAWPEKEFRAYPQGWRSEGMVLLTAVNAYINRAVKCL